ncbi:hypothetical protein P2Q00_31870 [Streptomyces coacervatus]|uniref:hypothetical protein n=1 Tax=Streptomyces coacervatus TaxID=647381 RepID=UPI0023D9F6F8|nr:hypothetical protein [Streptomyces coacervatus]MDF2269989.1 hypothetical protein [Streptomyces coacervatus]
MSTQPSYRSTGALWLGRLLGLGLILLAAVVAVVTVPELRSELAGEGTDGTLTVSSCEAHTKTRYGTHRRTTELKFSCTGTWTAQSGGATYKDVTVETSSRLENGAKIGVVQADDTFELPEDRAPGKDIAILAFCLSLLTFGIFCLLTGFGTRNGPGLAASWQRLPAQRVAGPALGGLFVIGALTALVCALVV